MGAFSDSGFDRRSGLDATEVGVRLDAEHVATFDPIRVVETGDAALPPPPVLGVRTAPGGLAGASRWQLLCKRAMDVAASTLLLVVLAPLLLLVAAAIRISSPGPALFVQERMGRKGTPFRVLKFRSMYRDAEERLDELELDNEVSGPVFKIRSDPRITPVGRIIRKLSIDELPQLLNVLWGHMSLVGPRPPLRRECELYAAHEWRRLDVKPGLTCIWQVSGRSDVDFATWVRMDLQYIQDWSLGLDVRLLLKTIPAVLTGRGAY